LAECRKKGRDWTGETDPKVPLRALDFRRERVEKKKSAASLREGSWPKVAAK